MDWVKLIGLSAVLFMLLEVISAKLAKFKTLIVRIVIFAVMGGASVALGVLAPVLVGIRAQAVLNACAYFITEYFLYLFLRNELQLSLKKFILDKFGGDPTQQKDGIEGRR